MPVFSGKVLENFEKNGQGIMIETGKGAAVEAMNEGNVMFAGVKEDQEKPLSSSTLIKHRPRMVISMKSRLVYMNLLQQQPW